jgi:hypothetical protein
MLKRTRRTLWIVAGVVLLLAVAVYLRFKAPPEAARLLPESDGIVYVNLRPMHGAMHKSLKPVVRAPEYQEFLDATGFDWESDLDEAAIALHRVTDPKSPNYPVAYSMVLVGKLDGKRMGGFLEAHATSKEGYAGHTIYSVPSEGRTVRIAMIGYDTVAISNTPTPEQIHSMLDRHRSAALPFSGSTLLAEHYSEIPLLSVAWGMGRIGLPFAEDGKIRVLGMALPLEPDTAFLASVRWPGGLRVEEIAPSETVAAKQAASLTLLLDLAKSATVGLGNMPANNGLKELLRTAQIRQIRNRVVVNATVSGELTSELLNGPAGQDNK